MKKQILIYLDAGVSPGCAQETPARIADEVDQSKFGVQTVDSDYIKQADWFANTALLIIPGGRSQFYYEKLSANGNARIRDYVKQGGRYLGICGGGYYACARTEFAKGHALEVCRDGELDFFPGTAIGPAYGAEEFQYNSQAGAHLAPISWIDNETFKTYTTYYNGGCYFANADRFEHSNILATYDELPNHPAAIIECQYGKGKALLTGVHPEYSYRAIDAEITENQKILNALKNNEKTRRSLLQLLLGKISL